MNEILIKNKIEQTIAVTAFIASDTPKATVVIASATGVKQGYYQKFSIYLKERNFNVYTFDYTGIGKSKFQSLKEFDTSASSWGTNDLESVITHVKQNNKNSKLIIVGHSIGGQLTAFAPSARLADGILLVASQNGYWKFWKGVSRLKMYAIWHVLFPLLTSLYGYLPGKKTGMPEDLPKSMAMEWRNWCCTKNYLFDLHPEANQKVEAITCPVFAFSADDDDYAPKKAVDWFAKKYSNASVRRQHFVPDALGIKKIGHFGFFRSKFKESIWNTFLNKIEWICLD